MKRFLRYIPILIAVGVIISLTLMNTPKNVALSEQFRGWLVKACEKLGISTDTWWNSSSGIRKLGHIIEYGLLGIASGIAFIDSHRRLRGMGIALGVCIIVSVLDQVVKIFVPIRHFDIVDIGFDLIGAVGGILVMTGIGMVFKKGA